MRTHSLAHALALDRFVFDLYRTKGKEHSFVVIDTFCWLSVTPEDTATTNIFLRHAFATHLLSDREVHISWLQRSYTSFVPGRKPLHMTTPMVVQTSYHVRRLTRLIGTNCSPYFACPLHSAPPYDTASNTPFLLYYGAPIPT